MSVDPTSQLYAAYAASISTLALLGTLSTNVRLVLAPLSDYSIPSGSYISKNYQNYNIFRFGNNIPDPNSPLLIDSTRQYTDAYQRYLNNVDLSKGVNLTDPNAVANAQTAIETARAKAKALIALAKADLKADYPSGVDPDTGEKILLIDYEREWYPDIFTWQKALADANARLTELLFEQDQVGVIVQMNAYRNAIAKTNDTSVFVAGYNMPVTQNNPSDIKGISTGAVESTTEATYYEPAYSIGGSFDSVVANWVKTFPTDYPASRKAYEAGRAFVSSSTSTSYDWSRYGYKSTTKVLTAGSGWLFWSFRASGSQTDTTRTVDITHNDFTNGISVSAWGIGTFPFSKGAWYNGNPVATFPQLNVQATQNGTVRSDVLQQFTSVIVGYGVEINFTLESTAYSKLETAITQTKNLNGWLSIFGGIFGAGGGSSSYNSYDWSQITMNKQTGSVFIAAKNNAAPIVIGALATVLQ